LLIWLHSLSPTKWWVPLVGVWRSGIEWSPTNLSGTALFSWNECTKLIGLSMHLLRLQVIECDVLCLNSVILDSSVGLRMILLFSLEGSRSSIEARWTHAYIVASPTGLGFEPSNSPCTRRAWSDLFGSRYEKQRPCTPGTFIITADLSSSGFEFLTYQARGMPITTPAIEAVRVIDFYKWHHLPIRKYLTFQRKITDLAKTFLH